MESPIVLPKLEKFVAYQWGSMRCIMSGVTLSTTVMFAMR